MVVLAASLTVVAVLSRPVVPTTCVGYQCPGPFPPPPKLHTNATTQPLINGAEFVDSMYHFVVVYPSGAHAQQIGSATSSGVSFTVTDTYDQSQGMKGVIAIEGAAVPAGSSPEQEPNVEFPSICPNASVLYQLTSASIGYVPGYGVVADCSVNSGYGQMLNVRCAIDFAVRNTLLLGVQVCGAGMDATTWKRLGNDGHPSIVGIYAANFADSIVNDVLWPK